jgi:hypothetical protein
MAGLALLDRFGAVVGAGAGEENPERHCGCGWGCGCRIDRRGFWQIVAGTATFDRMVDGFGHEAGPHYKQQCAEHGTDYLV